MAPEMNREYIGCQYQLLGVLQLRDTNEVRHLLSQLYLPERGLRVSTEIQKHNSMIFSMIFHDQQCNFHDYFKKYMASNLPFQQHRHHAEHKYGMQQQQHACKSCMHFEIIKA